MDSRAREPAPSPARFSILAVRPGWHGWAHFRRALFEAARPLPLLALVCYWLHEYDTAPEAARRERDPARSLAIALAAQGLAVDPADVRLLPDATPAVAATRHERALVRARHGSEPSDIYLVRARRAPDGNLLEISATYNLSDTSAAEEKNLVASGERAAWAITQGDKFLAVQLADVRGEPRPAGAEWTRLARLQNALTNLQETGQLAGVGRRSFRLDPPRDRVVLALTRDGLLVDSDAHRVRISESVVVRGASEGERYVKEQTPKKARPGNLVTWAVDRMRTVPWFGDKKMQLLKALAFEASDQLDHIVSTVKSTDATEAVAEELGSLYAAPTAQSTDPETGWPPSPMKPMIEPPLKGEGKWTSLDKDPFVGKNPGAPSPFVFSFIRTDRKRIYTQIFVTLWDPRQVELHPVSGTVEPRSATGETGTGEVPRKPEVMGRLVGAFNGGFQAIHGEFGMMADRVVYLPPKPYAATVAALADGSTGFGTWPESSAIPKEVVGFRQNMTPLVVDEVPNPYKRHWWGGVPPGWTQESRTVRSALCMTREGFVGYFYGAAIDPEVLALAMQRARCVHGLHLDMNAGHTGLEFYRTAPRGKLPLPSRPLEDLWEARGPIVGLDGWEFMSRRMIRLMALMNFPRYVGTEQRDFFYLTLRHVLPGEPVPPAITPAEPGEGAWRTHGLEQHGWPAAIATTNLRPEPTRPGTRVGLVKLDPRLVRAPRAGEAGAKRIVEFRTPALAKDMATALFHGEGSGFSIGHEPPDAQATRISAGYVASERAALGATAAVGVDRAGMLLYARVTEGSKPGSDGALLRALLETLGCEQMLFFPHPLGAELAVEGAEAPVGTPGSGIVLVRREGPGARRIFPDTPIVGPRKWAPLQQHKVKVE
ncbi:MAG TPA: hypothetical protein VFZ53_25010 [Polyangiaceae bacterium]